MHFLTRCYNQDTQNRRMQAQHSIRGLRMSTSMRFWEASTQAWCGLNFIVKIRKIICFSLSWLKYIQQKVTNDSAHVL